MNLQNVWSLGQIYLSYIRRRSRCTHSPIFIGVETSGICNLRCVMCPYHLRQEGRGLMDFEVFRSVIDEAKGFVQYADLFGGGEPLLHPKIAQMVEYATSAGIRVRLHTNATRLTEELGNKLIDAGLDYLSFSFDGYDKETYERVRVNGRFEESLENIRTFLRLKKERKGRQPYTVLQTIEPDGISADRLKQLRRNFRRQFSSLPIDEFKVIQSHNYGGKVGEVRATSTKDYSPCTFLWYASYVLWDGTIVPCCVDWWAEYPMGKVPETRLMAAWNSELMVELRKKLSDGHYREIKLCNKCDRLWRKRHIGVPARSVSVMKNFVLDYVVGHFR